MNAENREEQLKMLQKTAMNAGEKNAVRNAVISYMKENPLPASFARNSADRRLQYQTSTLNRGFNNKVITKTRMTIAIIIALLLGGGTSFAAENALPGDVLYPIKIHVNENVEEIIAVSSEAEAKLQAKLAVRRLEEAEKLAVGEKLNAETSADLSTRFEEHSKKSKERQEKVQEGNNADAAASISSDVEVSLGMHKKLLEDIEDSKPKMKEFIVGILDGVQVRLGEAESDRREVEAKEFIGTGSDAKTSADGAMKAAQNKIEEVKKFFASAKDASLNADMKAKFDAQIKAADFAMAEGKAKMEAQAYADAFALFKKAARMAQAAKLFVTASQNLYVRGDVSTEADDNIIACPQDAMICPDGTGVGRTGPNCEFAECPTPGGNGACTRDAKLCPDGSYVGRTGPNCEFKCPTNNNGAGGGGGSDGDEGVLEPDLDTPITACTLIYAPVCGVNGVTFSNSCVAKAAKVVIAYSGECSDSGGQDIACTMEAKLCPDGSAVGRTGPDCEFAECPAPISQSECRTDRDCASGYECIDPSPVIREGYPSDLRCWKIGAPHPICLSGNTEIATPHGDILVKNMKEGMSVWTVDKNGKKVAGTILLSGKTLVPSTHKVVHIKLSDGRELFVSPGHKISDGRSAGKIVLGDTIDGAAVILSSLVLYTEKYTYDILASGETGMYFANGILLRSTLK
jgi:hypothetical protein